MIDHADDVFPEKDFDDQFERAPYYGHFVMSKLLKSLKMFHQYDLKRSEPYVLKYMQECWSRSPAIFWENSAEIFEILAENKGLCDSLWHLIEPYVPSDLEGQSRQDILGHPLRLRQCFEEEEGEEL